MRLLTRDPVTGHLTLTKDLIGDDVIPPYAILSHTWLDDEVTFDDITNGRGLDKGGYAKLRFCGEQAERDGLKHFWIDTCCINKSDHVELQDAINSMFRWYRNAVKCYVYLSDVSTLKRNQSEDHEEPKQSWLPAFSASRWFTRGWTLQELLAPYNVEFFSRDGKLLGNKSSLEESLSTITGIDISALRGTSLSEFDHKTRFSWAENRNTTRKEDKAYSLIGIFGVSMIHNYGEGEENAFKRLREEIERKSKKTTLVDPSWKEEAFLESLKFNRMDARHVNIKKAHAKTCEWLLHEPGYLDWLDPEQASTHNGFLWIKGKPGTGKSTLMKYVLAQANRTMQKAKTIVSFFFHARGTELEKSTIGTYRSLLLQLLERHPKLPRLLLNSPSLNLSKAQQQQWTAEQLKDLFEQAILHLQGTSIICFVDALDECEESEIRDMIKFFERIGDLTTGTQIRFNVCLSSRHYPHITIRKGISLILEQEDGHMRDIHDYLRLELNVGQGKVEQDVRQQIQEKASGIFMWVVLVVDILNKEYDRGRMHALKRRLQEIPSDLHELLRDILLRDSHDKEDLFLCIQWVLFAKQPLTPRELYFAILAGNEPDALSNFEIAYINDEVIKRFILDSSKGLTEITIPTSRKHDSSEFGSRKVQFIHESVRDFLLKGNGLKEIWPEFDIRQSHDRLKQGCLTYMQADIVPSQPVIGSKAPHTRKAYMKAALFKLPFLEYAVQHVLYHANEAEGNEVSQALFIRSFPLSRWLFLYGLCEDPPFYRPLESTSLLYTLADFDMAHLLTKHLPILTRLEVEDERYGTPLFTALTTSRTLRPELLERWNDVWNHI